MNKSILIAVTAFLTMGATFASIEEANAVVCARGVYHAGCVAPGGAAVVRRPAVVHRPVVVAPPRAVIVR
jgi:hypothetical protein